MIQTTSEVFTLLKSLKKNDFIEALNKLVDFSTKNPEVQILFAIGSLGRLEINYFSDIDIAIVVSPSAFNKVRDKILGLFKNQVIIRYPQKLVVYFQKQKKIPTVEKMDLWIISHPKEIKKYIIESQIPPENFDKIILYRAPLLNYELLDSIRSMLLDKNDFEKLKLKKEEIIYHVNRFLEAFENCSKSHKKSDLYRFYFEYNIALHHLIALKRYSENNLSHLYLPKFFISSLYSEEIKKFWAHLILFPKKLKKGNKLKKILISTFLDLLNDVNKKYKLNLDEKKIAVFLRNVYERDKYWNFIDIAELTPNIKPKIIYRSSSLVDFLDDDELYPFLKEMKIKTIIDLRTLAHPDKLGFRKKYNLEILNKLGITYHHVPIDPFKTLPQEKEWLKKSTLPITNNAQMFYYFFPGRYLKEIKEILTIICESASPIMIHCYAGQDRTGIIVALLMKILNLSEKEIIGQYLTIASDKTIHYLQLVFHFIESIYGGFESFLEAATVSLELRAKLNHRLLN